MVFESLMVSGMLTAAMHILQTLLCIYCAAMFNHYSFRIFYGV